MSMTKYTVLNEQMPNKELQKSDILMPNGHASSFEAWNSVTYCSGGYILCSLMRNKQNTLFSEEEALKVLY